MHETSHTISPNFSLPTFESANSFSADAKIAPSGDEKYVVFFLGDEIYAVSSEAVAEIASAFDITPLPNAPEWLFGIANLRGEVIPVVNLPAIFKKQTARPTAKSKFIILRSQAFSSAVAFTTDKLCEIAALPNSRIEFFQNANLPYFFGQAVYDGQSLNLIDTEKVLSSLTI